MQAQPAEEFCFSFRHPIAGVERLHYDLVVGSNRGKRMQLRECKVLILHQLSW